MMMRIPLLLLVAFTASGCMAGLATRAHAQQRDPTQLLVRADADGDGRVTSKEYTEARARMFDKMDRNHDGVVNSDDAPKGPLARRAGGERIERLRESRDTNGDGRVTRDEFVNGPALMFDRADTNGDDVVDQAELAALRGAVADRRAR